MERPTRGEVIIAACATVLLVLSPIKLWGSYECPTCPADARRSQVQLWSDGFSLFTKAAMVLVAVLLVVLLLRVAGVRMPWPTGRIYVGLAFLITVILVITIVRGPSDLGFGHTALLEIERGPLLLLAWVPALGLLYGALLHMRLTTRAERRPSPGPVVLR